MCKPSNWCSGGVPPRHPPGPPSVPPGAPIFPIFSGVGPVGLGLDFPRLTVSGATDVGCPGTYRPGLPPAVYLGSEGLGTGQIKPKTSNTKSTEKANKAGDGLSTPSLRHSPGHLHEFVMSLRPMLNPYLALSPPWRRRAMPSSEEAAAGATGAEAGEGGGGGAGEAPDCR